jgi:hypothetical protein
MLLSISPQRTDLTVKSTPAPSVHSVYAERRYGSNQGGTLKVEPRGTPPLRENKFLFSCLSLTDTLEGFAVLLAVLITSSTMRHDGVVVHID